jgi:hypothetical protein
MSLTGTTTIYEVVSESTGADTVQFISSDDVSEDPQADTEAFLLAMAQALPNQQVRGIKSVTTITTYTASISDGAVTWS